MLIYHITPQIEWERAQAAGSYRAASLDSEGFIHFSGREQVLATAARFYHAQTGLVLLAIASERLAAPLQYENTSGGTELFPHLYGALNLDAVVRALPFPPRADGSFEFPEG